VVVADLADVDFPDVHDVLITYLRQRITDAAVDTVFPEKITGPVLRVLRIGGTDNGTTDFPRVEVTAAHRTFDEARKLGERARQELLVLSGRAVDDVPGHDGPVLIDSCRTDTPPEPVPYDNPDVDRHPAVYVLALRRPRRRR
jgi:hypothetical protein